MKFATFIIVDDTLSRNREKCEFTVNGDVIYPLETPMPVIQKGKGCIGIGYIMSSTRRASSTTITFKLSNCSAEAGRAYYDLYRNQISVSNDVNDAYDNASDMVIPGMMMGAIKQKPSFESGPKPSRGNNRRNARSLSDYLDDDDDSGWD